MKMRVLVFVVEMVIWTVAIYTKVQSLQLANEYPAEGNFSYVTLICFKGPYRQHVSENAKFLWNQSNLTDAMMRVKQSGSGKMTVVLTQEVEGEFQCLYGGNRSKPMQLAGTSSTLQELSG